MAHGYLHHDQLGKVEDTAICVGWFPDGPAHVS